MIQLPRTDKNVWKKNTYIKYCQVPGCGKEFITSSPIAKYCEFHKAPYRHRKYRRKTDPAEDNLVITNSVSFDRVIFKCGLPGCNRHYETQFVPKQKVYPKYCELHRNKYKREHFLKKRSKYGKTIGIV
jgi:hypothetical protein